MSGNEGVGAAHEAVKKDERGLILHRPSLFEVREAKAIELNMTALHHDEEIPLFRCRPANEQVVQAVH